MTNFEIQCCLAEVDPSKVEHAKRLVKMGYSPWAMIFEAHITHREAKAVYESCQRVQL